MCGALTLVLALRMKSSVAAAFLVLSTCANACPSPRMPVTSFVGHYSQIFWAVVTGIEADRDSILPKKYIENFDLEESERPIIVTDGGGEPDYKVKVQVLQIFKGKAPRRGWLKVSGGCHTEIPQLYRGGIFVVEENGDLIAGYEQSEFFDFPSFLREMRESAKTER
jgi:hypothetical protein